MRPIKAIAFVIAVSLVVLVGVCEAMFSLTFERVVLKVWKCGGR